METSFQWLAPCFETVLLNKFCSHIYILNVLVFRSSSAESEESRRDEEKPPVKARREDTQERDRERER